MSLLRLPWRADSEPLLDDPQQKLDVTERVPLGFDDRELPEPAPTQRLSVVPSGGQKPEELVTLAANHGEWTRQEQTVRILAEAVPRPEPAPPTVPPQDTPPSCPGLWWYRDRSDDVWYLTVVLDFGGTLCIRLRRGGAVTFRSVSVLPWQWAGPAATPAGLALEDIDI